MRGDGSPMRHRRSEWISGERIANACHTGFAIDDGIR